MAFYKFHYPLGCAIPRGHSMDQELRYQHNWKGLGEKGFGSATRM